MLIRSQKLYPIELPTQLITNNWLQSTVLDPGTDLNRVNSLQLPDAKSLEQAKMDAGKIKDPLWHEGEQVGPKRNRPGKAVSCMVTSI